MMASTMVVIMLLLFISPLVIPLVLFNNKKLRGVFDNWLKQLIGYSLIPLILFLVLGIYFKVLDHALYGDEIDDVFTIIDDGQGNPVTVMSDECKEIYIPCVLYKLSKSNTADVKKFIGIPIPWVSREFLIPAMLAVLRLLFVFAVMFMVFNMITKSLIASVLQVQAMEDDVIGATTKGLKMAGKMAGKALSKTSSAAKKMKKKIGSGDNDNNYGTGGKGE